MIGYLITTVIRKLLQKKTVIRRYRQRQGMIMWRITISVVERVILTMLPANLIFRWNVRRVSRKGMHVFFSRWKLRTVNQDTYYQGLAKGYFNGAGLTTCEVYLIKAECLARQVTGNDFSAAMDVLNKVRKTRILPEIYQPLQASTLTEAIDLIRRTKDNELIFTIVPFADARRFNAEGTFARALSKTWEGQTYTLTPASHLWIMPFPAGAVQNPGNGTITQNVSK